MNKVAPDWEDKESSLSDHVGQAGKRCLQQEAAEPHQNTGSFEGRMLFPSETAH